VQPTLKPEIFLRQFPFTAKSSNDFSEDFSNINWALWVSGLVSHCLFNDGVQTKKLQTLVCICDKLSNLERSCPGIWEARAKAGCPRCLGGVTLLRLRKAVEAGKSSTGGIRMKILFLSLAVGMACSDWLCRFRAKGGAQLPPYPKPSLQRAVWGLSTSLCP